MSEVGDGRQGKRSPNFPGVDLETAIGRAKVVFDREKMNYANADTIAKHWGYSSRVNGMAALQLGALDQYGLLEFKGSGADRQAKLTSRSRVILQAPDPDQRKTAVQDAALAPSLFLDIHRFYSEGLPSDENMRWHLTSERGFTDAGAERFVRVFRSTMDYAGLSDAAFSPSAATEEGGEFEDNVGGGADVVPPIVTTPVAPVEALQTPASSVGNVLRIPLPLVGGQTVVIEGNFPLASKAWDNFLAVLHAMRPGLVDDAEAMTEG